MKTEIEVTKEVETKVVGRSVWEAPTIVEYDAKSEILGAVRGLRGDGIFTVVS